MPELPDVELYLHALRPRIVGHPLEAVRFASPFLLRSIVPPVSELIGRKVVALKRLGKRIVWDLGDEYFVVIHLMIAGRFRWKERAAAIPAKLGLARGSIQLGYDRLLMRDDGRARALFDNLERVPYGPVDPELILLRVSDLEDRTRALMVH